MSHVQALHQMTPINDGGTSSALAVAVADLVAIRAELARAQETIAELVADQNEARATLARVRVELAGAESEGQGFVSLSTIRAAMEPTERQP